MDDRTEEAAGIVEQDQDRREVYAVAGPVGSGKSTFAEAIKEHHDEAVTVFEMSEYVRTLWKADGDASAGFVGDNALGEWAAEQKNKYGDGYFAKKLAHHIDEPETPHVAISGIRSPAEVDALRDILGNVTTTAIWTMPKERFERRYGARADEEHPEWETFMERNERELDEWGCAEFYIPDSEYHADYIIPNTLAKLRTFRNRARSVVNGGTAFSTTPFFQDDRESIRPYL